MFKFAYHTDWPERLQTHQMVIDKFVKHGAELVPVEDADVVLNVDSIHNTGFKKGKKLTLYWEVDDYLMLGKNTQYYEQADITYIVSHRYLPFYPAGTKVCQMGADPDFHKEDKTVEKFDYIFIGSLELLPCYEQRHVVLDKLMRAGHQIFHTYGTQKDYPKNMSRGKVILNVLPYYNGYACPNTKVFEAMAIGCLMINYDPVLDDMGEINKHYLPLSEFGKVSDEQIEAVKKASREHVINNHTWEHRALQMIKDINEHL